VLTWEGRRPPECSDDDVNATLLDRTVNLFAHACQYARDRGVELTVEVHPFTLGIQVDWLMKLCDRLAGLPFSVTYDCCHFGVGLPEGYVEAIDRLGPRIGHVHFSDSDKQSSELHFAPGTGCLDLEAIVAALERISFHGTMMLDLWLFPLPDQGADIGVPYMRQVCKRLGLEQGVAGRP
jgi:sugar phosphate isomerase/epimerase